MFTLPALANAHWSASPQKSTRRIPGATWRMASVCNRAWVPEGFGPNHVIFCTPI